MTLRLFHFEDSIPRLAPAGQILYPYPTLQGARRNDLEYLSKKSPAPNVSEPKGAINNNTVITSNAFKSRIDVILATGVIYISIYVNS